jgi:hypothetical protein
MRRAAFLLSVVLLAACGSTGGLGDISDIILGSPSSTEPSDVKGTVQYVDTSAQRIDLDVSYINNLRTNDSQRGAIYYDSRTRVVYQGNEYRVTDLERGDQIEVRGSNVNGRYVAETITVVRDVS